jgi:hypothetical protein
MELFSADLSTVERLALGVFSLIGLIVWCRWRGAPYDQKKDEPAQVLQGRKPPNSVNR